MYEDEDLDYYPSESELDRVGWRPEISPVRLRSQCSGQDTCKVSQGIIFHSRIKPTPSPTHHRHRLNVTTSSLDVVRHNLFSESFNAVDSGGLGAIRSRSTSFNSYEHLCLQPILRSPRQLHLEACYYSLTATRTGYTYINSPVYRKEWTPNRETVPMPHMMRCSLGSVNYVRVGNIASIKQSSSGLISFWKSFCFFVHSFFYRVLDCLIPSLFYHDNEAIAGNRFEFQFIFYFCHLKKFFRFLMYLTSMVEFSVTYFFEKIFTVNGYAVDKSHYDHSKLIDITESIVEGYEDEITVGDQSLLGPKWSDLPSTNDNHDTGTEKVFENKDRSYLFSLCSWLLLFFLVCIVLILFLSGSILELVLSHLYNFFLLCYKTVGFHSYLCFVSVCDSAVSGHVNAFLTAVLFQLSYYFQYAVTFFVNFGILIGYCANHIFEFLAFSLRVGFNYKHFIGLSSSGYLALFNNSIVQPFNYNALVDNLLTNKKFHNMVMKSDYVASRDFELENAFRRVLTQFTKFKRSQVLYRKHMNMLISRINANHIRLLDLRQDLFAIKRQFINRNFSFLNVSQRIDELYNIAVNSYVSANLAQTTIGSLEQEVSGIFFNSTTFANTTSNSLNNLSIFSIVERAIMRYDADKTGLFDFALESAGGSVISTRCTQSFTPNTARYSILGFPLWYGPYNTPRTVIQPGNYPGDCWAFKGSQGYLLIKLSTPIRPTMVSLEHISKLMSPSGEISSAPKNFSVFGFQNEEGPPTELGSFQYNDQSKPLQSFTVNAKNVFSFVQLNVLSNYGNLLYTCLYRFRVHGVL